MIKRETILFLLTRVLRTDSTGSVEAFEESRPIRVLSLEAIFAMDACETSENRKNVSFSVYLPMRIVVRTACCSSHNPADRAVLFQVREKLVEQPWNKFFRTQLFDYMST